MNTPKLLPWTLAGLCTLICACSGGGGGGAGATATITLDAVVQDLALDPNGTTTVVSLSEALAAIDATNFEADGGQTPVLAQLSGAQVTVLWDERVTPAHQVRIIGLSEVVNAFVAVDTSDDSVPSFAITDAQQVTGLGADVITVEFDGPRVVEAQVESASSWTLRVAGQALDLTGSVLTLDVPSQVLTIVTGPGCNLHSSFDLAAQSVHSVADVPLASAAVAGTASGDSQAPALLSAEQNLAQDEFGRVIDFTFDEAMDPVFSVGLASFVGSAPDLAIGIEQPAGDVLRVTFNNPIVPGVNQVSLEGLVDAHGNAMVDVLTPIGAGSTVPNAFVTDPELTTLAGAANDTITAGFEQALDPDTVADWTRWQLSVDGSSYDLSNSRFDYDFLDKTLTITLSDDVQTGDAFVFGAALGNAPLDVDGEPFVESFGGTIGGDQNAPALNVALQNRTVDSTGKTVDVTFSEQLDESSAENLANWGCSHANPLNATLLPNGRRVRVSFDALVMPTVATIACGNIEDLAGNTLAPILAQALTSNDLRDPFGLGAQCSAVEGNGNDTLTVTFNDDLYESDVEDPAHWWFESPVGTPRDVSNASIDYDAGSRSATLTFSGATGIDVQRGKSFQVSWTGVRDIGGNGITSDVLGGAVDGESSNPEIISVWLDATSPQLVHVRLSEPCRELDDINGWTLYVVRNSAGLEIGSAWGATVDPDDMGVELDFGVPLTAGSDVLDVSGIVDAAGNPLFARTWLAIDARDSAELALDGPNCTALTLDGERNDSVVCVFDRQPSPWGLLELDNYSLSASGNPLDLGAASIAWDGALQVTITLDAGSSPNLTSGALYDLTVQNLLSAQGVAMTLPSSVALTASGDASGPDLPAGAAKLDASSAVDTLLIEMSEALDPADATDIGNILLNGAINPDSAELVGFRTVRAVFSGGVVVGDTVQVDFRDLAGNLGSVARAVTAADVSGPQALSVAGFAVSGAGGDYVQVSFDRQLDLGAALSSTSYTLANGGPNLDLTGASLSWDSSTAVVTLHLPAGVELNVNQGLTLDVTGIQDLAGLALAPAASLVGSVLGDMTAPGFGAAFVNYREAAAGTTLDVLFDETVESAFASQSSNWLPSGGGLVLAAEHRGGGHWRLSLAAPLLPGETLGVTGLPDLAGNLSGAISIPPLQ